MPSEIMRVTLYRRCANSQVIALERSAPALFERNVLLTPFWQRPASPSDSLLRPCAQIIRSHQCCIGRLLPWTKFGSLDGNQVVCPPVSTNLLKHHPGTSTLERDEANRPPHRLRGEYLDTDKSLLSLGITSGIKLDGLASGWTDLFQFR